MGGIPVKNLAAAQKFLAEPLMSLNLPRPLPLLVVTVLAAFDLWIAAGNRTAVQHADPARQIVEERFPNGGLHVRREVIDTADGPLNDGTLTVWYESGQLRSQGQWQSGRKHGPFEHWHANGRPAKRVTYRDGLADGRFQQWDEQGAVVRDELWRDGRRVE